MNPDKNAGLTLGSLFDGSGGFPLAGLMAGITPVWASEIEPFPIRVTTRRFPGMKHCGDITALSGAELPPVDIITGGSPCQDLSVAGKRAGIDGGRSCLFFEMIRIIDEMRKATDGRYPKYCVWENVYGVLNADRGEAFRRVLESWCRIADKSLSVPRPPKWLQAGELVGDDFSIAWRTLDAQYWGVPQRRKRVYLVADFTDGRAGQILFESEGLPWNPPQSLRAGEGSAAAPREGAQAGGGGGVIFSNHGRDTRFSGPVNIVETLSATYGTGGNNQPFVVEEERHG